MDAAIRKDNDFYALVQERWKAQASENPDGVILHYGCDGVRAIMFLGASHIEECRCNSLRRYENIFWDERVVIRTYYKARAEKATQEAAALQAEEAQDV